MQFCDDDCIACFLGDMCGSEVECSGARSCRYIARSCCSFLYADGFTSNIWGIETDSFVFEKKKQGCGNCVEVCALFDQLCGLSNYTSVFCIANAMWGRERGCLVGLLDRIRIEAKMIIRL